MEAFFDNMGTFEKVLWYIAVPFSLVLILQTVLTFIGGGDEIDPDTDSPDTDEAVSGFRIFTVRNMVAFFTFFSWTGITLQRSGSKTAVTLLISAAVGTLAVIVTGLIFMFITRMTEKGNIDYINAVGKEGNVYLAIPPALKGKGKLEIKIQSSLSYVDAMTADKEGIRTGEKALVTGLENNILIVTSIKKED